MAMYTFPEKRWDKLTSLQLGKVTSIHASIRLETGVVKCWLWPISVT
jgi:hypothetical protein